MDKRQRYYINRVSKQSHLDWESRLGDVQPGDDVQLVVVKPLAWHLLGDEAETRLPVAGLQTADTVNMDTDIAVMVRVSQGRLLRL